MEVQVDNIASSILVCEECGSTKVQTLTWVSPNTNEVFDELDMTDSTNNWCSECKQHTDLTSLENYRENQENGN